MPLLRLQLLAILIVPFSYGSRADDRLNAFFAREWALTLQENPTWAASLGQPNAPARWTDSSPEAWQRRVLHAKSTLQELALLNTSPELSPDQQLNAALFRQQQENLHQRPSIKSVLARSPASSQNSPL